MHDHQLHASIENFQTSKFCYKSTKIFKKTLWGKVEFDLNRIAYACCVLQALLSTNVACCKSNASWASIELYGL